MSRSPSPAPAALAPTKVDRTRTPPFYLKLFYRANGFHRLEDFKPQRQPPDYIIIYTWRDCTLSELSLLLSASLPSVCNSTSRCGFRLIYADTRYGTPRFTAKDLGAVALGEDAQGGKTLSEVQFVTGDWIDVAVYGEGHGAVPGAMGGAGGGGLPMREGNGFRGRGAVVPNGEWRRGERVEGDGFGEGGGFERRPARGRGGYRGGHMGRGQGRRWGPYD